MEGIASISLEQLFSTHIITEQMKVCWTTVRQYTCYYYPEILIKINIKERYEMPPNSMYYIISHQILP